MTTTTTTTTPSLANSAHLAALNGFELIKQGAEAKIYTGVFDSKRSVAKERFAKRYRHPDLDRALTRRRIKNEVKLLDKARSLGGVQVPLVYKVEPESGLIFMEMIDDSITCREFIINLTQSNQFLKIELKKKYIYLNLKIGN